MRNVSCIPKVAKNQPNYSYEDTVFALPLSYRREPKFQKGGTSKKCVWEIKIKRSGEKEENLIHCSAKNFVLREDINKTSIQSTLAIKL